MRRRHDPFLKRLYRAGARDALTLFFPDLAASIDWREFRWIDKEIVIPGPRSRSVVADLVGETRDVEGRYLKVLLHPELQMEPDPDMDWRAFQYNAGLLLREGNPRVRVLTFAFYHCRGTGGIQERQFSLDYYGRSIHHVTYWSVGLGELDAETYAAGDNPMGWALASWMRQKREGRVELRLGLIEKILKFVRAAEYQGLLLDAIQTYYKLSGAERRAEERLVRSGRFGEVDEMAQTVLGRMEAKARREGRVEALQQSVRRAILTRFPDAPGTLTDQVERVTDPAALDDLLGRVIAAPSLQEIERLLNS